MKKILYTILLFLACNLCLGQSVTFTEMSITEEGGVIIGWKIEGTASRLEITRKTPYSPVPIFSTTDPGDIAQGTYHDHDAMANDQKCEYKILTVVGSGSSATTFIYEANTVFLNAPSLNFNNISLVWERPSIRSLKDISILRLLPDSPTNTWETVAHIPLDSTNQNMYSFSVPAPHVCSGNVQYCVEYKDPTKNITYRSNASKVFLEDKTPPSPPNWNNVSYNPITKKIRLTWEPSLSEDIGGYQLCEGDNCQTIDTIWGNITSYECRDCDPRKMYKFKIKAFDACSDPNEGEWINYQSNIVLTALSKDCPKEAILNWNPYINMSGGLAGYNVYMQYDDNAPTLIQTTNPTTTSFNYSLPDYVYTINFYVEAFNSTNTIKALSNTATIILENYLQNFVDIQYATVHPSNELIEFNVSVDSRVADSEYLLYRGVNNEEPSLYKTLKPANNTSFNFSDSEVYATEYIYTYYLTTKEGCVSNITTPIRAQLNQNQEIIKIQWNPYIGWEKVESYDIERKLGNQEWFPRGNVNGSTLEFEDNVQDLGENSDRILYRVIANYKTRRSTSSIVELIKEGYLKVPNAFIPTNVQSSLNSKFRPRGFYMSDKGYLLNIYSRTGELVFHTTNPEEGWDGSYKGKPCPVGTYVYIVSCVFLDGRTETRSGTVLLLE